MKHRKVVITGLGMVTAVGNDRDTAWEALKAAQNGIGPIESFDTESFKVHFAGEVKGFDPHVCMDPKEARKADRFCQLAVGASVQAMDQADITEVEDPYRAGVIIGSGIGGMLTFEEQHSKLLNRGARGVSPMFIPMMIGDMASGLVSIRYGFRGANFCTVSACASGGHAIAAAYDQIVLGHADVMITGGAEAAVCPMALAGFANMRALSTRNDDPATASRPFDAERDGFVLGEGAGILVIESEEHALKRGANILGYLCGYGATGDAYHMTQPDNEGKGAYGSMAQALRVAGLKPEQVGYINAHGTSTHFNDKIESRAIRQVFGDHADKLKVSSTKSMVGHLLGAAGAIEAAITTLALKEGILPPTINYQNPDAECDLFYCPNEAVAEEVDFALSNSFGFGGHNVTLCLGAAR
ncbi:beta-ketoacyl-[acyl-carrier-protein] synthase II [bacterium DOLZORAL124_64_63]|nr:MAG: beta-ketoacyl-[acyl-carrier-protein] synthase II [bacterium DOLZORAL124_64_63]